MNSSINVAVCADKNIEVGLHVTLYSLMDSLKGNVKIYLVHKGYSLKDIDAIHTTLNNFKNYYNLIPIEFDDNIFQGFRGLYGNKFTFTRLMLPEIINEDKIIYLDSDLVVKLNLLELFQENLNDYCLGASGIEKIKWTLDSKFLLSLGLTPEASYFNAGVLLLDIKQWRRKNLTSKCLEFAKTYPQELLCVDQTILNYIFYNDFMILGDRYNFPLYPGSTPISINESDKIFHFVGSPKPWDFLGEYVHKNYHIFKDVLEKTHFNKFKSYHDLNLKKIIKTLKLSRAYYKSIIN